MGSKILIISYSKDLHADYVASALKKRKTEFFRFDIDRYPRLVKCEVRISDDSETRVNINHADKCINAKEIKSVIYFPSALIRPDRYDLREFSSDVIKEFITQESDLMLAMIFEGLKNSFWINHPDQIVISKNKLNQLKLAKKLGFLIPETLLTNTPDEADDFIKKNSREGYATTLKTMSGISRKIGKKTIFAGAPVQKIIPSDLSHHRAPMFLQRYIEKKFELRITVVGNKVFPCEIHSQLSKNSFTRVDWRVHDFENVVYKIHNLPDDVRKKCLQVTKKLGLNYSAIDMILSPDNDYVFLEINSHGLWQWIEVLTGLPISDALADLLIKGEN